MLHLCRTCHGETAAHNCVAINDNNVTSLRIKSQLMSCVPELQQDLIKDPVLCSLCVDALHSAYAFKAQCLETEARIQNYFQNTTLVAQNVTLLELYKEFGVTHNFIKVEHLTVKLSNTVACNVAHEVADTKHFEVSIPKEEVYDINEEGMNDSKNNSASEVNEVSIVKEECEITQFKVDEDNFKKDSSDNELETLEENTKVEDRIQEIQTSEIELKELCLLDKASTNTQEPVNRTRKCCVKLVRIKTLRNPKLGSSTKSKQNSESAEKHWKGSVLANHVQSDSDKNYLQCVSCEYRTTGRSNLNKHMRTHTGEKPYWCNVCEFRTAQKGNLKIHMRTHTGEKPFQCDICDYRATNRKSVILHLRIHTGEKPFQCTICAYRAGEPTSLNNHMRTHTGEKPFQCTFCEFRTAHRSTLKKHIKTHSGKKRFQCTMCEFRSSHRTTFNQHLRTHSDETPFHDNEVKTDAVANDGITKEECDITQFKVDEDNFKYDDCLSDNELDELEGKSSSYK